MKSIAVVMAVYNEKPEYLKLSIESILIQTFADFEFIIVLDNPENRELEHIITNYAKKDQRINFLINENNIGLAESLNRAIRVSKAEIIARMDADDISFPERLEKTYAYLNKHKTKRLVSVISEIIDAEGKTVKLDAELPTDHKTIVKRLEYFNFILHPGAVFYKSDFIKVGGYRQFPAAQDYDLWLRYVTNHWEIGILNEHLLKYRVSDTSISSNKSLLQWYCGKYAKQLYHERIRKGKDTFSEKHLVSYLQKKGCKNTRKQQQFKKGLVLCNKAKKEWDANNYIKAVKLLAIGCTKHIEILKMAVEWIDYYLHSLKIEE